MWKTAFYNILLIIDCAIYGLIGWVYEIFEALAKVQIFDADYVYGKVVNRLYVIIGLVMLFVLAYSLLRAVMDPDSFAKGETSFPNLIKNCVISLVIIALLPTVFKFAMNIQNSFLNYGVIQQVILGTDMNYKNQNEVDSMYIEKVEVKTGNLMAYNVFSAFFHANDDWCVSDDGVGKSFTIDENGKFPGITEERTADINESSCAAEIKPTGFWGWKTLGEGDNLQNSVVEYTTGGIKFGAAFQGYGEAIKEGQIEYNMLISSIAGVFVLYVLVNFCFDIAIRSIKLLVFEIIAPVAVVCRIIPGGQMKDVFSTWTKKTISTYIDLFVRLACIYLGVFLINELKVGWSVTFANTGLGVGQRMLAYGILIMGVVMFMKEAPKLLGDLFHLDTGGMSLGLRDKLQKGGFFAATGAAIGGVITFGTNAVTAGKAIHNAKGKGFKKQLGAGLKGIGSMVTGAGSGFIRGGKQSWADKNFKETIQGGIKGAANAENSRVERENYKAEHQKTGNVLERFANVQAAHVVDAATKIGAIFGLTASDQKKLDDQKENTAKANAVSSALADVLNKKMDDPTLFETMGEVIGEKFNDKVWKGANAAEQFEEYNNFVANGAKSLKQIKNAIEAERESGRPQSSDFEVKRSDFEYTSKLTGEKVFNEEAYNAAQKEARNKFQEAQIQYAKRMETYDAMYTSLEKQAQNTIKEHAYKGESIGSIDTSDLSALKGALEDQVSVLSRIGSVTDPISGETITFDPTAQDGMVGQIKDMTDAIDHAANAVMSQASKIQAKNNSSNK